MTTRAQAPILLAGHPGSIVGQAMSWRTYRRIRSECELCSLIDLGWGAVPTWRPVFAIALDESVSYGWARTWFRSGCELGLRVVTPEIRDGRARCRLR